MASGTFSDPYTRQRSPFISVWFSPRETIERIVSENPGRLVLLLAALSGVAGAAAQLVGFGLAADVFDWRALAACVLGGAILGVFNLYIFAFCAGWVGRKIGGVASAPAVRAAIAWGSMPIIFGVAIILAIVGGAHLVGGKAAAASSALSQWLLVIEIVCYLWTVAITLLMLSRVENFGFWRAIATYLVGVFLLSSFLALLIRTFLFQPFSIPARSMNPTLRVGDYIFASKYAYGYSRFSFPYSLPAFSGRIFGSQPERGDVVIFRLKDGQTDFVKRVVGLPGDRIQMKQGLLYINDVAVSRERLPDFADSDACGGDLIRVKRWRETLPNGASYETLDCVDNGFYDNTDVYTVPDGHYFMLGDNRDNSTDSRARSAMGYIPLENFIGRVGMIYLSRDPGNEETPPSIRYDRIGMMVR